MSDPKIETSTVATDAALMRENEMLKAQVKLRSDQLKQAIDIANKANSVQTARDEAEKTDLIDRIVVDSNNKLSAVDLADKSLGELRLVKTVLDKSLDSTFASIASLQHEKDRKTQPHLTVGQWDAASKTWKGGL